MLLQDKFYKVLSEERVDEQNATYRVALLADCDVYRGHFPARPIAPGVCNIEMIKECAMTFSGQKLLLQTIGQCRLLALVTPQSCLELTLQLNMVPAEEGYKVRASLSDATTTYLEIKAEMTVL